MKKEPKHTKLGEFLSTSICGNDILSSALYVSGIASIFAGTYAPLVLLAVAGVLFFYKSVYREVVEALPVNGGAYNALLNGTSKTIAAIAGVMTILSYVATAVISAKTAVEYLFKFLKELFPSIDFTNMVIPAVIVILLLFALLVIAGVKDSAKVAAMIFIFHIITLSGFIIIGAVILFNGSINNTFDINLIHTHNIITEDSGLPRTLFLAFAASLLGVSGFESSANFVEEQEKGVFKKTLRNMLAGVAIFNPLIALIIINFLPIPDIAFAKDFLLAEAALRLGGVLLLGWVAIDAFLVLCGAVLTSYIGVSGLVNRMSLDQCLPEFLSKTNAKKSHPQIALTFFVLCSSILLITKGSLLSLAGVYTLSFLGVMSLFALGNLILRETRTELKRSYHAPILYVILAFFATVSGLIGNILIDPNNLYYFLIYFIPAIVLVLVIIYKKDFLISLRRVCRFSPYLFQFFDKKIQNIVNEKFYVFIHHTSRLYAILEYINKNENGWKIKLIHCNNGDTGEKEDLERIIPYLKKAGVYPFYDLEFEYLNEEFGPQTIDNYSRRENINKNKIFIGSIHDTHSFDYEELGGVRIISS